MNTDGGVISVFSSSGDGADRTINGCDVCPNNSGNSAVDVGDVPVVGHAFINGGIVVAVGSDGGRIFFQSCITFVTSAEFRTTVSLTDQTKSYLPILRHSRLIVIISSPDLAITYTLTIGTQTITLDETAGSYGFSSGFGGGFAA